MDNIGTLLVFLCFISFCWICWSYTAYHNKTEVKKKNIRKEEFEDRVSTDDSMSSLVIAGTVSPIKRRIGDDNTPDPLVEGAFLVISHHTSGCFGSSVGIHLAVRNDGSVVYNNEEFGPGTLDSEEVDRIHELMIEVDFFNRWYKFQEPMVQSMTKTYNLIYYTDGKLMALLKHVPEYITDLIRSLEVRYRLKSKAHTEPIGKFVY